MSILGELKTTLTIIEAAGNLRDPGECDHSVGQADGLLVAAAMIRATVENHGKPAAVRKAAITEAARGLLRGAT